MPKMEEKPNAARDFEIVKYPTALLNAALRTARRRLEYPVNLSIFKFFIAAT